MKPSKEVIKETLVKAASLLSNAWTQGAERAYNPDRGKEEFCLIGGLDHIAGGKGEVYEATRDFLANYIRPTSRPEQRTENAKYCIIVGFNDSNRSNKEQIVQLLMDAADAVGETNE